MLPCAGSSRVSPDRRSAMSTSMALATAAAGAAAAAAIKLSQKEEFKGKIIVVILPDLAERYLSSIMFNDVPSGIIEEPAKG